MQKSFDSSHLTGLQWATALWEIRRSFGKAVLDPIVLTCWRRTAATVDDRTTFGGRLGDLAASTPRPPAANRIGIDIGEVLARHHLLRSR
jgi:hypothetical protein